MDLVRTNTGFRIKSKRDRGNAFFSPVEAAQFALFSGVPCDKVNIRRRWSRGPQHSPFHPTVTPSRMFFLIWLGIVLAGAQTGCITTKAAATTPTPETRRAMARDATAPLTPAS